MADQDDELLSESERQLDEANLAIVRLTAEHTALCRRLGKGAPSGSALHVALTSVGPVSGGYRGEDRRIRIERALEAANTAVAHLSIENSILRSRADSASIPREGLYRALLVLAMVTAACALVWLVTDSLAMSLVALVVSGLGWGFFYLSGVIEPTNTNAPRPPLFPGGG